MGRDWFVERREVSEVLHQRSGPRVPAPTLERGWSARQDTPGGTEHHWAQVTGDGPEPGALPEAVAHRARALLNATPVLRPDEGAAEEVARRLVAAARAAGASHLDVLLREVDRRTLFATEARTVEDRQRYALLEVKAFVDTGSGLSELWRCAAWPDGAHMHAALPELETLVEDMLRELRDSAPVVPCPSASLPVVFPPGAASACFFHEVCGHPLEGDVVARGGSYLARRLGQRVAGEHLSVSDDPTDGHGALAFAWDDEGHAA
ncbi:metallopeptidase TldD-related protein, partial [Pyxidicoccus sp. 3LFB2]